MANAERWLPVSQDWQEHSIERQRRLSWLHRIGIASVVAVALVGPVAGLVAVAVVAALAEPVVALAADSPIDSMQLVAKTLVALQIVDSVMI